MRLGFLQFSPVFGNVKANLDKILGVLNSAQADLIVLPELPFTGYLFADRAELASLAEDPRQSPTVEALVELCHRQGFHLVTGFAEKSGGKIYNSALLIGPSGLIDVYRKLHLFDREKLYFDPGDLPLRVNAVARAKIGMMVCFDWIFPEVCRVLALEGAEVICHPSNLVLNYCQQAMLTRTLENAVFAVTCNRTGEEIITTGRDARTTGQVTLRFTGQSQIAAPQAELLHRAGPDEEILFITEIDPSKARDKMMTGRNDLLADRRVEWYGKIINDKL
jgi:predicted amidohydrolase